LRLQPSEIGVEATAAAARRIGGFFNQRGEEIASAGQRVARAGVAAADVAEQHSEHMEIQAGAKHGSDGLLNLDKNWNAISSDPNLDPNDPSVAGKFMEETFEPWAEQFQSGFNTEKGQKFAQEVVDKYRNHFQQKTAADMAGLAKQATVENSKGLGNNLANMVFDDYTGLDSAFDILEHSMNAIVGTSGIPGAQKVEVGNAIMADQKKAIVQAAVQGAIRNGGDWKGIVSDPRYSNYISGPEAAKLDSAAKAQARTDEREAKQAKIVDQQDTDRQAGEAINGIISKITYDDSDQPRIPKGTVQALQDVLQKNPTVSERVRKDIEGEIARIGKTQGRQITVDNEGVKSDLNTRMLDPNNPTTRLQILQAQDKLTPRTFRQLEAIQKEVESGHLHEPGWKAVMQDSRAILGTDPIGAEKHGEWAPGFMNSYLTAKRAGTLEPNALNLRDPNSMISKSLEQYKRTPQQMMIDRIAHGLVNFDATGVNPLGNQPVLGERPGAKPLPVTVKSPEDAQKLNPGTRYIRAGETQIRIKQ
jgi:hypothetical protein